MDLPWAAAPARPSVPLQVCLHTLQFHPRVFSCVVCSMDTCSTMGFTTGCRELLPHTWSTSCSSSPSFALIFSLSSPRRCFTEVLSLSQICCPRGIISIDSALPAVCPFCRQTEMAFYLMWGCFWTLLSLPPQAPSISKSCQKNSIQMPSKNHNPG